MSTTSASGQHPPVTNGNGTGTTTAGASGSGNGNGSITTREIFRFIDTQINEELAARAYTRELLSRVPESGTSMT